MFISHIVIVKLRFFFFNYAYTNFIKISYLNEILTCVCGEHKVTSHKYKILYFSLLRSFDRLRYSSIVSNYFIPSIPVSNSVSRVKQMEKIENLALYIIGTYTKGVYLQFFCVFFFFAFYLT